MKVGIIGLGNIAEKAYLPVITSKEDIELVFCTRNVNKLNKLSNKYRIKEHTTSLKELISMGIDAAFVHTATESHTETAKMLLENGINVYIDKPISYYYEDALNLAELSAKKDKILMVGFNRRFAPMYKSLKDNQKPDIIIIQKNRVNLPDNVRRFIFDDFIHVVDTLRFLMDEDNMNININSLKKEKLLYNIVLQLSNNTTTAIGIMNRNSGISEETLEYMCSNKKFFIDNLVETTKFENGKEEIIKFNDWDPILYRRGFYQIISEFLSSVEKNKIPSITIEDSLKTHEICEKIVKELTL
ncbi:Gfo/Idh/MocA family protein [Clostridium polynesiense]|uniref:Gfo/Idh/MocA family protein n=1 Tax=Clostridium polynesiense TaxID=1325933 RepID=UPI00058D05AB|nr:Gfo/Idh/MocA family oxidoreductase [Clostridium polynesiense]